MTDEHEHQDKRVKDLRIPTTPERLAQALTRGGAERREPESDGQADD
jgi:hypothetical protein